MSILKKPYEISLWEDEWDGTKFVEKRIMTIGSNTMEFQGRALEPKLVRKTNGEVNFSFNMYYTYIDTCTGNKVDNPFVNCIVNESKIKLKYGDEWFDLLVKNIVKDSNNKTYSYTLVNQHVTELSKNGYDLLLDTSLTNNIGTLSKLGSDVVKNSGWSVEAEPITQTIEEPLVAFLIPAGGVTAYRINDKNLTTDGAIATGQSVTIQGGAMVYVFYSCCSGGKPYRFQFICAPDALKTPEELKDTSPDYSNFDVGSDRVIRNTECQYYIDNIIYNSIQDSAGIDGPNGWATTYPEEGNNSSISIKFRGKRYVYSEVSDFHVGLNQYLTRYSVEVDGNEHEAYKYIKTNYIVPTIIQNYITGADFATVSGWKGSKFNDDSHADTKFNPNIEVFRNRYTEDYDGTERTGVYIDSIAEACRGVDVAEKTYTNQLLCSNLGTQEGLVGKNKTIINTGPYDFRNYVTAFSVNEEYILNFTYAYISQTKGADYYDYEECDSLPFEFRVSNFQISGELNGYGDNLLANPEDNSLFYCADNAVWNNSTKDFTIQTTVKSLKALSKSQFLSDKYQVFLNFDGIAQDTEEKKYYILIKQLEFYKKIPKQGGGYYTLNETVEIDSDSTYQEEVRYFDCIEEDTRAEEDIVFLPENITKAIPKLSDKAEKITSINIKQSNYYNAIQTLAEAFQCWATIIVPHDDSGNIIGEKTIKFQNYIGQPNNAGFRYGINSKNITRTLESKDLVSKLMVKANSNQFAPNGFCAISRATANPLKENTMYNFDYYVNQKLMEGQSLQSNLYIPDTELTESNAEDYYTNPIGYYTKLGEINRQMNRINNLLSQQSIPLVQAQKDVTTNELGWQAAEEAAVTAKESFYKIAGFDYNRFPRPNLLLGSNNRKESTKINVGTYTWANGTPLSKHRRNSSSPEYIGLNRNGHSYVCTIDCTPSADYSWIALVQGSWSNNSAQNTERMLSEWTKVTGGRRQTIVINMPATSTTETAIDTPTESDYQEAKKMWVAQRQGEADSTRPGEGGTAEGMVIHYIKIEEVTDATDAKPTAWVAATEEGGISGAEKVRGSTELTGLLTEISMALCNSSIFKTQYEAAKDLLETLEESYAELEGRLDIWQKRKEKINKAFTQLYSRFIQEGTWIDESYMDDNLYYLGAQSVLYNSTMPKVSYSVNVISLSGLPGYEMFDFKIGDQTFVEDIEFFGYELDGVTPYQEQITITETTENLDDPSKNSIKVQNYENQFADLFQRITATVQSVQYSEGSYKKAAELASGEIKYKTAFVQQALESVDTEISNAAADSVILGKEGLVIENTNNGTGIRLIDGGLYLKSRNKDGSVTWKTGITADGISANLITAGQIDTSVLQIMNGKQPTFRWDSHGLTAYGFNNSDSDIFLNNVDTTRGVRFDRFGIYGYSGIDGERWHPQSISNQGDSVANIEDKSTFYLTWEGLKVKSQRGSTLRIGDNSKVNSTIDNTILSIANPNGQPCLQISDTGNLIIGGNGSVGQFQMIDNKIKITLADVDTMGNLYYGTKDWTTNRWWTGNENQSPLDSTWWTNTGELDLNGNTILQSGRFDSAYRTSIYQKIKVMKDHYYRFTCRFKTSKNGDEDSTTDTNKNRVTMSMRCLEYDSWANQDYHLTNLTANQWYTGIIYWKAPGTEWARFFCAMVGNNTTDADNTIAISSLCVSEIQMTDAEWESFKLDEGIHKTGRTSESYKLGFRAGGRIADGTNPKSYWEDNSSDKATIEFVVENQAEELRSEFAQTAEGFVAKVESPTSGAGWNLTDSKFIVSTYSNGQKTDKLIVDSSGLTVKGHVEAESGQIGPLSVKNNWLLYPNINTSYENIFDLQSLIGYTNIEIPTAYTLDYGISGDDKAYLTYNLNAGFIDKIVGITNNYTKTTDRLLCWPCNIGKIYAGKKYRISCTVPWAMRSYVFVMGFIPNSSIAFVKTNEATGKIITCGAASGSSTTKSVVIEPSIDFDILGLAIQASASSTITSDVNITNIMVEEINSSDTFPTLSYSSFIGKDKQLLIGADCISLGRSSLNLSSTTRTVKGDNIFVGKSLNIGAGARMTVAEQKKITYTSSLQTMPQNDNYKVYTAYLDQSDWNVYLVHGNANYTYEYWFAVTISADMPFSEPRTYEIKLKAYAECIDDSYIEFPEYQFLTLESQTIEVQMDAGKKEKTIYLGGSLGIPIGTFTAINPPNILSTKYKINSFSVSEAVGLNDSTSWESTCVSSSQDIIYTIGNIASLTTKGRLINWCLTNGESLDDTISTLQRQVSTLQTRVKTLGEFHGKNWT